MSVDAVLIAGPTASGKSAAALDLAERLPALIVNTDSMQVYRELRILTARPSAEDEARAPHRLFGHVAATERYSAGRFQAEAAAALAEARRSGRVAIFVGGTGLYFDALTKGLSPIPAIPTDVRENLRQRFDRIGREAFIAELTRLDPSAARIQPSDTQRLLRAMDVVSVTGRPLSSWQTVAGTPVLAGLRVAKFVIAPAKEALFGRIDRRFQGMVNNGALEEARSLLGLDPALPAARALGLAELWQHLTEMASLDDAVAHAQLATKQYVKRQLTWLKKHMADWKWLDDDAVSNFIAIMRD